MPASPTGVVGDALEGAPGSASGRRTAAHAVATAPHRPRRSEVSVAFLSCLRVVVAFDPELSGGVLRRHRRRIGSKNRALTAGRQALMVLVYLKRGETFAQLGAGFAVSTTTAWRQVNEAVDLLAARAPELAAALHAAARRGLAYLVLDGTLIPIDRVKADRPFFSGKHRRPG